MKKAISLITLSFFTLNFGIAQETLQTVTTAGNTTDQQINVQTAYGGPMYTGRQMGTTYGFPNPYAAIFYAKTDAISSNNVFLFSGYHGTNSELGSGINSFYVRGDGEGYFAGNVGIGITSPVYKLDVNGASRFISGGIAALDARNGVPLSANSYARGNVTATVTFDEFSAGARPGYGFHAGGRHGIYLYSEGVMDLRLKGETGQDATLWTSANFRPSSYLPLSGGSITGDITIGTTPANKDLAVNGNIKTRKVKVTQTDWADYVFDSSYQLAPLSHVEKFIQENKHLPEVPSAAEVKKDGLDLGGNQSVLLKKIEELTLYIIQQNKDMKEIRKELEDVKAIQRNSGQL